MLTRELDIIPYGDAEGPDLHLLHGTASTKVSYTTNHLQRSWRT